MSIIFSGYAGNVTTGTLVATITGIADNGSGRWRVTTSTSHFFGSPQGGGPGDLVHIQITAGPAAPVDTYAYIIVIDSTHFDVPSLSFSVTGTGTATDVSLTPQFLSPTDGDTFSLQLSGMLSTIECLADRTQYVQNNVYYIGSGPWVFNGNKTFQDNVLVVGNLTVDGTTTLVGAAAALDGLTVTGAPLQSQDGEIVTGANLTLGAAFSVIVASATGNAVSPIVATLATAETLVPGDLVRIAGGLGNTAINGTWVLSSVSGATVTLYGSTGNGTYTANTATLARDAQIEFASPRSLTRACESYVPIQDPAGLGIWGSFAGAAFETVQVGAGAASSATMYVVGEITAPTGSILSAVDAYYTPPGAGSGHAGAPTNPPLLIMWKMDLRTGTETTLATATGTYTSDAQYEVYTDLTATLGTPEVIDRERFRYGIRLRTETGTNALWGFIVFGASYTGTVRAPVQF